MAGAPKFEHQYNFCSTAIAGGLREVLGTLACYSINRTLGTLGTLGTSFPYSSVTMSHWQ